MNLDIDDTAIEEEIQKYESWRRKNKIQTTPVVLVNGYQLPKSYRIEDLQYII